MSPSLLRPRTAPFALALAITATFAAPAGSTTPQTPPTQVWIDVATHNTVGMPELGGMGGFAARMMDRQRTKAKATFPTTEHPGATGRFLDVALHNRLKPGVQAEDAIPAGLALGGTLVLLPPPPVGEATGGEQPYEVPDVEFTVHEYWGCGAAARSGQPRRTTFKVKQGVASQDGSMFPGQYAPERDVRPTTAHALWPNELQSIEVPESASLVGPHRFSGEGIPASLKFDLDRNADFMPKIDLRQQGGEGAPVNLDWSSVERAKAYFLQAAQVRVPTTQGPQGARGKQGTQPPTKYDVIVWSSSEVGGAGAALVDYLAGSYLDRWLKQKVLLPASATSCTVPQGIFDPEDGAPNITMLNMIAYGPETNLAYPPRPTDAKKLAAWKPEWSVRVRTKSTASLILGMETGEANGERKESTGRQMLRGLFKRGG